MRRPKESPGDWRATGAAAMNLGCGYCLYSRVSPKYQALGCLPQSHIGPAFEPSLSLAKDPTLADLEAAWT
jgi:hypothetical protein